MNQRRARSPLSSVGDDAVGGASRMPPRRGSSSVGLPRTITRLAGQARGNRLAIQAPPGESHAASRGRSSPPFFQDRKSTENRSAAQPTQENCLKPLLTKG